MELAIKQSLKKIELPGKVTSWLPDALVRTGFEWLGIEPAHALGVVALPWHHRDPFDRLLIAQAQCERLRLVTHDRTVGKYKVDVLWA